MKKPDMLKHVAGELMIWLLSHPGQQKPGDNGFLGESYPVQRELFVREAFKNVLADFFR